MPSQDGRLQRETPLMEKSLQADRQRHAPAIPVFRLQQRGAASSQAALVSAVAAGGVVAGVATAEGEAMEDADGSSEPTC